MTLQYVAWLLMGEEEYNDYLTEDWSYHTKSGKDINPDTVSEIARLKKAKQNAINADDLRASNRYDARISNFDHLFNDEGDLL